MNKKHILFIIARSDDIGGAHIHVRDMACWLLKRNYDVSVIAGGNGYYINHLKSFGINVLACPSLKRDINIYYDLKASIILTFLIRRIKPSLISIHSSKTGVLIRFLRVLKLIPKCIFTAHGWSFTPGVPRTSRSLYRLLETIFSRVPEKIITVCQTDLDLAIKLGVASKNKLICIHNGMPDIPDYKPKLYSGKEIRHLIMTARFESQKDHATLLKSLILIRNFNWKLTLLGKGYLEKSIYETLERSGLIDRVRFVGWTDNVNQYLQQADIYLLISKWEGFPRSILEALKHGMPVIASDVGGISESVINGENGFLIPREDHKILANSLEILLNDSEIMKKFGKKSRELYLSNFTFSKMAIKTEKIYKDIIS
tara:strand:- start:5318 stop:6430 length:1113 start_codon:yes stop_codon:yes gene_type:complete